MMSSDILATIVKDHQFRCFQCQHPVASASCVSFRGNTMITFKCHGEEETVAVPVFVLKSLREAQKCHQILDTLVPFLKDGNPAIEGKPTLQDASRPARACIEVGVARALPEK